MRLHLITGQSNELHSPLVELVAELLDPAKLGGADGGVVSWVGEQDGPAGEKRVIMWLESMYTRLTCPGSSCGSQYCPEWCRQRSLEQHLQVLELVQAWWSEKGYMCGKNLLGQV